VDIVDNLAATTATEDEAALAGLIRLLDDGPQFWLAYNAGLGTGETRRQFSLPGESSREALDRLFTLWVSEVRPRLRPDLLDPAGSTTQPPESAILLARIDFMAEESDSQWVVVADEEAGLPAVSDAGTPYLLHTQLIQELLLFGGEATLPDIREFVSFDDLTTTTAPPVTTLRLWFHADFPLNFLTPPSGSDPAVVLMRGTDRTVIQAFTLAPQENAPNGPAHTWTLSPGRARFNDGDLLTLRFDTDLVSVVDPSTPDQAVTLTEYMHHTGTMFVGYDGDHHIEVYHLIDLPPAPPPQTGGVTLEQVQELLNKLRTVPFVTISLVNSNQDTEAVYELWFHLDPVADVYEFEMIKPNVRVFAEIDNKLFELPVEITGQQTRDVWQVQVGINRDAGEAQPIQHSYLRFAFSLDENIILEPGGGDMPLRGYIDRFQTKFEGYVSPLKDGQESLVVYFRFPFFRQIG
jgi:hypothetical protein